MPKPKKRKYKGPLNGLARRVGKTEKDFNPRTLARGTKVEMEHTDRITVARRIAMDHLTEDPHYYTKLARMEKAKTKRRRKAEIVTLLFLLPLIPP